jgi:hypothetical protein
MTRLERFIENWPKSFSVTVRLFLKKFHLKELSPEEITRILHEQLESALNTIMGLESMQQTTSCGCEGSCPVCRIGEVENHKCDSCKAEFCPKCHGVANGIKSENVSPCKCKKIHAIATMPKVYREKIVTVCGIKVSRFRVSIYVPAVTCKRCLKSLKNRGKKCK